MRNVFSSTFPVSHPEASHSRPRTRRVSRVPPAPTRAFHCRGAADTALQPHDAIQPLAWKGTAGCSAAAGRGGRGHAGARGRPAKPRKAVAVPRRDGTGWPARVAPTPGPAGVETAPLRPHHPVSPHPGRLYPHRDRSRTPTTAPPAPSGEGAAPLTACARRRWPSASRRGCGTWWSCTAGSPGHPWPPPPPRSLLPSSLSLSPSARALRLPPSAARCLGQRGPAASPAALRVPPAAGTRPVPAQLAPSAPLPAPTTARQSQLAAVRDEPAGPNRHQLPRATPARRRGGGRLSRPESGGCNGARGEGRGGHSRFPGNQREAAAGPPSPSHPAQLKRHESFNCALATCRRWEDGAAAAPAAASRPPPAGASPWRGRAPGGGGERGRLIDGRPGDAGAPPPRRGAANGRARPGQQAAVPYSIAAGPGVTLGGSRGEEPVYTSLL